jgi:hypothetical protein
MSKRKEMKESNANSRKAIDESLNLIAEQNKYVPFLQEKKMEYDTLDILIDNASDDEVEELYSKVLPLQKNDEQNFVQLNSGLRKVHFVFSNIPLNTSGTTSSAVELAYTQVRMMPAYTVPEPVKRAYKKLADYKSRKVEIPKGLSHLQSDLGRMFSNVHDTVEKARNKIITVNQAILDMRDVLNHIWANLVDVAAKRCPGSFRNEKHKQFKKAENYATVAECLIFDPLNRGKFQLLLKNMYDLYTDISHAGKNPLYDDYAQLEEFYSRWILQIDGVVGMINWREWEDGYTY